MRAGGIGAWFPEALRNRGNPFVLQQFRAGGFEPTVRLDTEIWCICLAGTSTCWPRRALIGGLPGHVDVKVFRLCESSRDLLAGSASAKEAEERDQAIFLANHAREAMQAALGELSARPSAASQRGHGEQAKLRRRG
mmetsp:Transcript_18432/g.53556  ORF Transcript_18432/g.53556 Transcript_18432/m.53556 type:complete len:137 (+) Transcript_18432:3-413(+)